MNVDLKRWITVGKVGSPTGLDGLVKITSFTEKPEDIFEYDPWFVNRNDQWIEVKVQESALQGKYLLAKFVGCEDRDQARLWTNAEIRIRREQLSELPEGQYYWSDLEGMTVKTVAGVNLGKISEVMETGANPVLVVEGKRRYLLPYLPEKVVKKVDLNINELVVDWEIDC